VLAEKLDESLDIITGLWTGKQFSYTGKHYRMQNTVFIPQPKQKPRIPIWVAGYWPHKAPFKRASKWDGIIPLKHPGRLMKPEDLSKAVEYVRSNRRDDNPFEVANIGWTSGVRRERDAEKVNSYANAGMTWWLESPPWDAKGMRKRIRHGPPVS